MPTEKPVKAKVKSSQDRLPNFRQQRAVEIISEKLGKKEKVVIGEVLREAGYSQQTSDTPKSVTGNKTWKELLQKTLKEKGLLKKHKQLIESSSLNHYTFPGNMTDEQITKTIIDGVPGSKVINIHRNQQWARAHFSAPDNQTQLKSLELAYKIGGKMSSDPIDDGSESQEIREVIFRIKKILPQAGQ